jgi:hypothetical protein
MGAVRVLPAVLVLVACGRVPLDPGFGAAGASGGPGGSGAQGAAGAAQKGTDSGTAGAPGTGAGTAGTSTGTGAGTAGTGAGAAGANAGAAGTSTATGAAGASAGAPGTGAVAGAGAGGVWPQAGIAICQFYCDTIMSNCKGPNQQYADLTNCMKVCSFMPAGAPTDFGVDSVGCRTNAARAAASDARQCLGAGPLSYGVCGNDCNTFCTVATSYCTVAGGFEGMDYQSADDCESTCGQFGRVIDDPGKPGVYSASWYSGRPEGDVLTDTLECRAYHLFIRGLQSSDSQRAECPNAANASPACGPGVQPVAP